MTSSSLLIRNETLNTIFDIKENCSPELHSTVQQIIASHDGCDGEIQGDPTFGTTRIHWIRGTPDHAFTLGVTPRPPYIDLIVAY